MNPKRWLKRIALTRFQKKILDMLPGDGTKTYRGLIEMGLGLVLVYYLGYNPLEAAEHVKLDPELIGVIVGAVAAVKGGVKATAGAYHKVLKTLHKDDEDDSATRK